MTDSGLAIIDHGFIDSQEANARLRPVGVGGYLLRRARSDKIISYIDEEGSMVHVSLPWRHDSTLFVSKPSLTSLDKVIDFLTTISLRWLTPVPRGNNNYCDKDSDHDPLECHICDKKCGSLKELRAHDKSHRESFCPKCEKMVAQRGFSRHKSICNRDLRCKIANCNYIGENLIDLKQHVKRIHSPGTPFQCSKCSKTFKTSSGRSHHFAKCHRDANANVDRKDSNRNVDKMDVDEKKGPEKEAEDRDNTDADIDNTKDDQANKGVSHGDFVFLTSDLDCEAGLLGGAEAEDEGRGRRQARGKRVRPESLSPPPPRKRGRPKGRKPAQCPHCDYFAPSKSKLKRHVRKHSRPKKNTMKIECDHQCGYSSFKRSHVKIHMRDRCPERLQSIKRFSKSTLWDLISSHTVSNRLAFSLLKKVEKSTGVKLMPPYAKKLMSDSLNIFMQDITGEIVNFKVRSL